MLVAEKGVLSSPNLKLGRTLSTQTDEDVKNFYLSDDHARQKGLCFRFSS